MTNCKTTEVGIINNIVELTKEGKLAWYYSKDEVVRNELLSVDISRDGTISDCYGWLIEESEAVKEAYKAIKECLDKEYEEERQERLKILLKDLKNIGRNK